MDLVVGVGDDGADRRVRAVRRKETCVVEAGGVGAVAELLADLLEEAPPYEGSPPAAAGSGEEDLVGWRGVRAVRLLHEPVGQRLEPPGLDSIAEVGCLAGMLARLRSSGVESRQP